ncbi:MAG TPA: hypothetical protein VGT99_11895 [Gammaproteobacteria bacterium]|nr:hypothetical protein [Gammaproteobacteria bacterium]
MADDDQDLDLIPPVQQPAVPGAQQASTTASPNDRLYLEAAYTQASLRDDLIVPPPAPPPFTHQERILVDVRHEWQLDPGLHFVYSSRLNFRDQDDLPFPDHENIVYDLREAYLNWQASDQTFMDFGRINLKDGIALGYNPTDYFKTRSVTEPLSIDPSSLRDNRLGTVMVRAQHLWEGGSLTAAFAPALHSQTPIYTEQDLPDFNPQFDRTNAHNRLLLKASLNVGDSSPEVLLYREAGLTQLGTNLSASLGQKVVAYFEWSGGERPDLITEALDYGKSTGSIPPASPSVLSTAANKTFKSKFAVGASYTTGNNITFNLEYHVNQAGFSASDWDNWFALGQGAAPNSPVANELWYIRGYAQDQQEQNTRQSAFLRADWVDAFGLKLELTGFTVVDLHDGSGIAQIAADWYASNRWTLGGLAVVSYGSRRSDFGSLSTDRSVLLSATRYF